MTIGKTIKRLRHERNITQGQLAEYLGISPKAVSQWECDRTSPDISQLPLLASVFEVTTDEILGVDVDAKKRKITEISARAQEASISGNHDIAIGILREGLARYPDSHLLMNDLAGELWCKGLTKETAAEATALLDKILSSCTDNRIRNSAVLIACQLFPTVGRRNDALELAHAMAGAESETELLPLIYEGHQKLDAKRDLVRRYMYRSLTEMGDYICMRNNSGEYYFTEKERLAVFDKIIRAFELFYENGDYYYDAQVVEMSCTSALLICAEHKDARKAIEYAEKAARCAIMFDTYDPMERHTSILMRGMSAGDYYREEHNRSYNLLEFLRNKKFDFLYNYGALDRILQELKAVAK